MGNSTSRSGSGRSLGGGGGVHKKKKNSSLSSSASSSRMPQMTPGVGTFTSNDANLVLFGQYLEDKQLRRLTKQAVQRKANDIKRISLLSCSLGMDCPEELLVKRLTQLFSKHAPNLEWLLLTGPMLFERSNQVVELLVNLPTHSLERLSLGFGGPRGAHVLMGLALARLLSRASKLNHLSLHKVNWRDPAAIQALAEGVLVSTSLSHLDLSQCRITDRGFQQFASTLCRRDTSNGDYDDKASSCLETLLLNGNHITSSSLKRLAKLIQSCQSLKCLDMSNNTDLFDGAQNDHLEAFFQSIEQSTTLEELNLSSTGLDKTLMERLLQAVSKNPNLQTLHVSGNSLSRSSRIQLLTEFMPKLEYLSGLYMHPVVPAAAAQEQPPQDGEGADEQDSSSSPVQNAMAKEEVVAFLRALRNNKQLTQLTVVQSTGAKKKIHSLSSRTEEDDAKLTAHIQDVLRRNQLNKCFEKMETSTPEGNLALWPQFLARQSKPERGHPSSVYQVLHHHMHSLTTS